MRSSGGMLGRRAARAADRPRQDRSTTSSSSPRIEPGLREAPGERARELGAIEQRVGVGPLATAIAEIPWATAATRAAGAAGGAPGHGVGRLGEPNARKPRRASPAASGTCARPACPRLRQVDQRGRPARRSPSLSRNTPAMRSTAAGGGSSDTKCVTSFVATKRAVDSWRHSARMAASPSLTRFAIAGAEDGLRRRARAAGAEDEGDVAKRWASVPRRAPARVPAWHLRRAMPGPQAVHRPPGEELRQLLHVLLRVSAVHAERVQFEQLARVVLVQAATGCCRDRLARPSSSGRSTGSCRGKRAWPGASPDARTMSSNRPKHVGADTSRS
jgi:hypothetical protein